MKCSTVIMLGVLFIASGLLLVTDGVEGKTITVDATGGGNFTKIQDAVNISSDGDTIRVWGGTYYENVVVNRTVNLIGNGSELTTIDGGGVGDVVTITSDRAKMSGFTVTGSGKFDEGIRIGADNIRLFENNCSYNYYGIYLGYSSNTTITRNTFSHNQYGTYLRHFSNATLTNNTCISNNYYGICLEDSSYCVIMDNNCSNNSIGIKLEDSSHITISNNTCSLNNQHGILLDSSKYSTIMNNTIISNNHVGINIYRSSDATITNNTCSSNGREGILFEYSSNSIISNNRCLSNRYEGISLDHIDNSILMNNSCSSNMGSGIHLETCKNVILANNSVSDNSGGINVANSKDVTLKSNTMSNNFRNFRIIGSSLSHYDQSIGTSNTVDGKPIYYILGKRNETIDIDALTIGFLACIGCDNITVRNASNLTNNGYGILFKNTNDSFIQNIMTTSNQYGIYLQDSNNNALSYITASNNSHGMYLIDSNGNTLTNTTASNSSQGMELINSNDNTLTNNNILDCNRGLIFQDSSFNTLTGSTLLGNRYGIYLSRASFISVTKSTFKNNENGIYLSNSHDNAFMKNTISENEIGIYLRSSSRRNVATNNNIFNNSAYGVNASENDKIEIDARNNWWGNDSSPHFPTIGATGNGDNVTVNVLYKPWLIRYLNFKPSIMYVSLKNYSTVEGIVEIIVTAFDHDGYVSTVDISINGSSWIRMEQSPFDWKYLWDTRDIPDGETEISFRCFDGESYSEELTLMIEVRNSENDPDDDDQTDDDGQNVITALFLILSFLMCILISVIVNVVDVRKK